jgi:hypothetical protein
MRSVVRLMIGIGIFVVGYHPGRAVTRTVYIRQELEKSGTTRTGES